MKQFLVAASIFIHHLLFAQMLPPSGLMCELMQHPELSVITDPAPEFGWIVNAKSSNCYQKAYRILVSSSPELSAKNTGDIWDSKKVSSSISFNNEYSGPPLGENKSYWWKVQTWDQNGKESGFSLPHKFNTGSFHQTRTWPGESKWVSLKDNNGTSYFTFENRPPVTYNPVAPLRIVKKTNSRYFVDFGKSAFATLKITVDDITSLTGIINDSLTIILGEKQMNDSVDAKPGGTLIYLTTKIKLNPAQNEYILQLPRFVPKYPHSQSMPAFMPEVIPFRYCEIINCPYGLTGKNILQLSLYSLFDDSAASFTCSDKNLNQVYDLCKYSIKVNMFNGDYASSQRERMMYEADNYIHQMGHYAADREYAVARYSIDNSVYHATWPTEWIMFSVICAWADYIQTGNTESFVSNYEELKAKTLEDLGREDGLISTRAKPQTKEFLNKIHFNGEKIKDIVDWPPGSPYFTKVYADRGGETDGYVFTDYNTVVNAFHYKSLMTMSEISKTLNKKEDAKMYRAKADKVKKSFNQFFFNTEKKIYTDGIGTDHSSLHANMFALAFGLVDEINKPSVIQFIKSRGMACSVYAAKFLLDAMFDNGEAQYAIDLMTATHDRSWMNMINTGSTITTEAWDLKYKLNSSWTHGWSTSPVHVIPYKLMGIEARAPGFSKISIQPRTGNLAYAEMKLPVTTGTIFSSVTNNDEYYLLKIRIPANCSAEVNVPDYGHSILCNGKESKINIITIGSGNYEFKSLKK